MARWNINTLYAAQETTFATDPDADGSDYKFLKTVGDVAVDLDNEVIERPGNTGTLTRQPAVAGVKGGKVAFKLELKASGTPAASGVAATASEASPLLEAALGSVFRGTGDTTQAGSTSTVLNVTDGTRFRKGMLVAVGTELAFVQSVAANALTLDKALAQGAPANGTVVTASSLFTRSDTGHKTVALAFVRDGTQYTALGCQVVFKVEGVNAGNGTALVAFECMVADWSVTTKASLPTSAAATIAGINAVKGPVVKGSLATFDGVSRDIRSFSFDPALSFVYKETVVTDTAKSGSELVDSQPAGELKPYYNADHLTDLLAQTEKRVAVAVGTTSTGWGWYAQKAQWTGVKPENAKGLHGEGVTFKCNDNGTDAEYFLSVF